MAREVAVTDKKNNVAVWSILNDDVVEGLTSGLAAELVNRKSGDDAVIANLTYGSNAGPEIADARFGQTTLGASLQIIRSHGVDIRDYGATDSTGGTDHSAAFAAASAAGDLVWVPAGQWQAKNVALRKGLWIEGVNNRMAKIRVTDPTADGVICSGVSTNERLWNTGMRNIGIQGPMSGTGRGILQKFTTYDVLFDKVQVLGFGGHGVYAHDSWSTTWRDCFFDLNGGDGYHGWKSINNTLWERCVSGSNGGSGFYLESAAACTLQTPDSESNGRDGIEMRYTHGCVIISPEVENNVVSGIHIGAGYDIHDERGNGTIPNAGSSDQVCTILGGDVTTSPTGLWIESSNGCEFRGTYFINNGTDHVKIAANGSRTRVGPCGYAGTGNRLTNASVTTAIMDYSETAYAPRFGPGIHLIPQTNSPAAGAVAGSLWYSQVNNGLALHDGAAIRRVAMVFTKAGIPTDADFVAAPPDGTMVTDTTNHRIYVRSNALWKYAALT